MDSVVAVLVALASVFVGYLLSLWRNRISPWVALLNFWETESPQDLIDIPEKLRGKSVASLIAYDLPADRHSVSEIKTAYVQADQMLDNSENSEHILASGIERLRRAEGTDELLQAIESLLLDFGISSVLEMAILASEIRPKYDPEAATVVDYYEDKELSDGCFYFVRGKKKTFFGSDCNKDIARKTLLKPMMELVSRLERDKLLAVFEALQPIVRRERDLCRDVAEVAKPFVDSHTRWACAFTITNYGATPFIVFPEYTTLSIKAKGVEKWELPCDIARADDDYQLRAVTGVVFIRPGTTEDLTIVTKDMQKDIPRGNFLRTTWEQSAERGHGEAFLKIRVRTSELPWSRWIKSTPLQFGGFQ